MCPTYLPANYWLTSVIVFYRTVVSRYKYLRQSVKLTGLGEGSFSRAIAAAQEIYGMFDCHFLDGTLELWFLSYLDDSKIECLDASNRYFTPSRDAPGVKSTPFHLGVDPQNVLANMMSGSSGHSFIHMEDNQVQYYRSRRDADGERRYGNTAYRQTFVLTYDLLFNRFEKCEPQMFRVGDVVEVQLSFVGVPLRDKRRKMLTVLRSMALLDGRFSMVRRRQP